MITLFEYKDKLLYVYSFDAYRRSDHFYDWIKDQSDKPFKYKGLDLSKKDI